MKYLIYFLPSLALANFVSESGSVTYADKSLCEKTESAECFEKPIDTETKALKLVEVDDLDKPILDAENKVIGYEKKQEKKFVEDAAKVAEKLAKENAKQAKEQTCDDFKALLADSAIDDKSKAADVMEVTRRLLGYWKSCRQ